MADSPLSDQKHGLPPVTVICGFLGAGKTTLLNHLLSQAEGRRWAAVVNDVAAINIDGALVRRSNEESQDIVELGNGCVCCSQREELGETIAKLAMSRRYEHIIVETTGVAEPRGIASLFTQKNPFSRSLSQVAQLSALISVVDSRQFLDEWRRSQGPDRSEGAAQAGSPRPIFELMVEQVECADLVVLNKADLLDENETREVEALVEGLNSRAEKILTERSQLGCEVALDRVRFSPLETVGSASWIQSLNTLAPGASMSLRPAATAKPKRHEARFGIGSFVFRARQPFNQNKLEAFFRKGWPGLLRAKGFFWIDERPDEMGFLSLAGAAVQYDFLNYWWASVVERGRATKDQVPPAITPIWQEPFGDRRQEIVFIGVQLDEAALNKGLEGCFSAETPSG